MASNLDLTLVSDTLVVMLSIGNRKHLTDYTFPPLAKWATSHGYSAILLKKSYNPNNLPPHFNKLLVHKTVPGFKRYIIVDDDLLMKKSAPAIQDVPSGYVGLCRDAEQGHTDAPHVKWTANSGFIVTGEDGLNLLEEAYYAGEHNYVKGDGTFKAVWPYFGDQSILNYVLFKKEKIYELDWRWNYQPILDFFINEKNWNKWKTNKVYRLSYYSKLIMPFKDKYKQKLKESYGVHMIKGVYPSFFSRIHK